MALPPVFQSVARCMVSSSERLRHAQRLVWALGLSLLIHCLLMASVGLQLPSWQEDRQLLEATIVSPPPPVTRASAKPLAAKSRLPAPRAKSPPPVAPQPQSPAPEATTVAAPAEPGIEPASAVQANQGLSPAIETSNQVPALVAPSLLEAEEEIVINPNAYKYVETVFDVHTELNAKPSSSPAGKASMVYELLPNGEMYQIKSMVQAKGLLALFMPSLLQTSAGYLTNKGLQPKHYLYQFGDKKNKTYSADFDWDAKKLQLHSEKGTNTVELLEGTQDLVSFMYQFMFVAPLQNMQLTLTNGKKLGVYDYGFEGEETISTKLGDLKTLHLIRRSDEGDEKTELWLALDYQYVPVKISKTQKDGKIYELLVTSLSTNKPASNLQ